MKFYDFPMAPSPRRARIVLAEKQVPHEVITVDLATGEQLGEAFGAINPARTVPVLELDDGTRLTENAGIAAYLEAEYPDPPLLGRTSLEKAMIANWVAKLEFDGLLAIAEGLRNGSPHMKNRALTGADDYAQIPELAARGVARTQRFFERLNEHLQGRDFIVTEQFTYADIVAVVVVDFARAVKVKPLPEQTELLRWRESLAARPSLSL